MGDGLIKQVQILLDNGADVYHRDISRRTLLEVASEYGFVDVAEALIARAPDLVAIAGVRVAGYDVILVRQYDQQLMFWCMSVHVDD